ncbi:hypothetical protein Pan153_15140 [Gimesia panareensis]|uniref:Uncharacterized protein n=1 Tax=Gimesia panareensis TaxID=2527978 RepID=A0A518FKP6_9PLAN|nr:hypothetical protein [Gimesia panareensis]QDV16880.1 hypothetical protein Pan153_15140 [Gimesia panareensis]
MFIPTNDVIEVLVNSEIDELFHANSVATSCQFLRRNSLISRGTMEQISLYQTPQKSDDKDQEHGVWFDIFFDSIDIHMQGSRPNKYGPVLFIFERKIIESGNCQLGITKSNPLYWKNETEKEKWFHDKKDLEQNFKKEFFRQMIVVRFEKGEVILQPFLKKIILDDPVEEFQNGLGVFETARDALILAMKEADLDVPVERRQCKSSCKCKQDLKLDQKDLYTMYSPNTR